MIIYFIALGLSIAMAVLASFKFMYILDSYRPFALYLIVSGMFDLIGFIASVAYSNNLLVSNIFILIDPLFWLVIFYNWEMFSKNRRLYFVLLAVGFVLTWFINIILLGTLFSPMSYYRILYSFVIALLAINTLNYQIVHDKLNPLRSPRFLAGAGALIFFTHKVLLETFFLLKSNFSLEVMIIINFISKIIFLAALIWIPDKPKKFIRS